MGETLLLIGRHAEMEAFVAEALQTASSHVFTEMDEALEAVDSADLVIVLQHWPDEYTSEEVRQVLETFSLSRIIIVQGDWCASDRRTRQYWPASLCVPYSRASDRLQRELEVLNGKRSPLPWTAGLDEIFAFDHDGEPGGLLGQPAREL